MALVTNRGARKSRAPERRSEFRREDKPQRVIRDEEILKAKGQIMRVGQSEHRRLDIRAHPISWLLQQDCGIRKVGHVLRQSPSWCAHIAPKDDSVRLNREWPTPEEFAEIPETLHPRGNRA